MEYTALGRMFVALAVFFGLGLTPYLAHRFYPTSPNFRRRLAAPLIFMLLATACFAGLGLMALFGVAAVGSTQILLSRWQQHKVRIK